MPGTDGRWLLFPLSSDAAAALTRLLDDGTSELAQLVKQRSQGKVAMEQQIPTCDLTPALVAAQKQGQDPYFLFDGHWSPSGHAVVARRLAECLQAPGLQ